MYLMCAENYPSSLLTLFSLTSKHNDHEDSIVIDTISPLPPSIWQAIAFLTLDIVLNYIFNVICSMNTMLSSSYLSSSFKV
jgi:hypothetical protein